MVIDSAIVINFFEVAKVNKVNAYEHEHQLEYVQVFLRLCVTRTVDELAEILNLKVALTSRLILNLQAAKRIEHRNLVIDCRIEHCADVAKVDIPGISRWRRLRQEIVKPKNPLSINILKRQSLQFGSGVSLHPLERLQVQATGAFLLTVGVFQETYSERVGFFLLTFLLFGLVRAKFVFNLRPQL